MRCYFRNTLPNNPGTLLLGDAYVGVINTLMLGDNGIPNEVPDLAPHSQDNWNLISVEDQAGVTIVCYYQGPNWFKEGKTYIVAYHDGALTFQEAYSGGHPNTIISYRRRQ